MDSEYLIKAVISKHVNEMLEEIGSEVENVSFYIPDNAQQIITRTIFSQLEYGKDVEDYLQKQGHLKKR